MTWFSDLNRWRKRVVFSLIKLLMVFSKYYFPWFLGFLPFQRPWHFIIFFLHENILFFFSFIFISWRLITSQHCSGFCHTLTWTSHGFTCVPHPDPPSHLPLHPIPLGLPSAPGPSTYLVHPAWAGDLFHYR